MARSRGPAARGRRQQPAPQRRLNDRRSSDRPWIIIGTVAVLVVAAVIITAGFVWSVYLPPRAHVVTVGSADFTAGDVADRAFYLTTAGNGAAAEDPAGEGIASLSRQQILLEFGSGLVDPVTDEDVRMMIARRLGLVTTPTPGPTPTPTPGADPATPTPAATAAGTPTATPTPVIDDERFPEAYADFLRTAQIDRDDFEGIIRAGIVEERLRDLFETELPESGDQMELTAIRTNDRAQAQALVDAVAGGQDFAEAAVEVGIAETLEDVQAPQWFAPEALDDRLRDVLSPLQAGQTSGVVDDANRIGFEVYYVAGRTSTEPYDTGVVDQLTIKRLAEFIEQWETTTGVVKEDLSDKERTWIARWVQDAIAERMDQ